MRMIKRLLANLALSRLTPRDRELLLFCVGCCWTGSTAREIRDALSFYREEDIRSTFPLTTAHRLQQAAALGNHVSTQAAAIAMVREYKQNTPSWWRTWSPVWIVRGFLYQMVEKGVVICEDSMFRLPHHLYEKANESRPGGRYCDASDISEWIEATA